MSNPTLQDFDHRSILSRLHGMNDDQLKEEFLRLVACRNTTDTDDYNLPIYLTQFIAEDRGVTLPEEITTEEIKNPKSRGISWLKYFFIGKCLQVQYKSSPRIYTFYNVPRSKFVELKRVIESGESLGHFVDTIKKDYGLPPQ
jgi:hypothetical protein